MINSESSELKQIVRGNIPPNTYFSEEEHFQMFGGEFSLVMICLFCMLTKEYILERPSSCVSLFKPCVMLLNNLPRPV